MLSGALAARRQARPAARGDPRARAGLRRRPGADRRPLLRQPPGRAAGLAGELEPGRHAGAVPAARASRPRKAIAAERAGEQLWLRVERQTLRRLPRSGDVLFGIRTHLEPLAAAIDGPAAARALAARMREMPAAMAAYKGIAPIRERCCWPGARRRGASGAERRRVGASVIAQCERPVQHPATLGKASSSQGIAGHSNRSSSSVSTPAATSGTAAARGRTAAPGRSGPRCRPRAVRRSRSGRRLPRRSRVRALLGALAELEIARRHRPEAGARLDRAAAQQDAVLPGADRADHDLGVAVVDLAAGRADVAIERVARGPLELDRGAACGAEPHRAAGSALLEQRLGGAADRLLGLDRRLCALDLGLQPDDVGLDLLDRPGGQIGRLDDWRAAAGRPGPRPRSRLAGAPAMAPRDRAPRRRGRPCRRACAARARR